MASILPKRLRVWLRDTAAPQLAGKLYKAYTLLIRDSFHGWDRVESARARGPVILCHWHGDDLALIKPFGPKQLTMMVSRSRDGELLARILGEFGYRVVRGSTNRGGVGALKEMAGLVRSGADVGLTVDGPTGPRARVKMGVIALAKLTGAPIFPAGVAASRKWLFAETWHQTYLPKPGSRVQILFDRPLWVDRSATKAEMEAKRLELEEELFRVHEEAARRLRDPD